MPPTIGQLSLLIVAGVLFAAAWVAALTRIRGDTPVVRAAGEGCLIGGILVSSAVIIWHSVARGSWIPLGDNFDALIWLAALLAISILYIRWTRPLAALEWFVTPIVVLLLLGAVFFGSNEYHDYINTTWGWVHRVTSYGGAVAFAIAAGAGALYVLTSRNLRRKTPLKPYLSNLERLEHLTMIAVTLGFALLSVGMITGGVRILADGEHTPMAKIVLAVAVWFVYAIVLHAPINPSFRGRKVAVLSMVGFLLMISTIVAVQLLPGGHG